MIQMLLSSKIFVEAIKEEKCNNNSPLIKHIYNLIIEIESSLIDTNNINTFNAINIYECFNDILVKKKLQCILNNQEDVHEGLIQFIDCLGINIENLFKHTNNKYIKCNSCNIIRTLNSESNLYFTFPFVSLSRGVKRRTSIDGECNDKPFLTKKSIELNNIIYDMTKILNHFNLDSNSDLSLSSLSSDETNSNVSNISNISNESNTSIDNYSLNQLKVIYKKLQNDICSSILNNVSPIDLKCSSVKCQEYTNTIEMITKLKHLPKIMIFVVNLYDRSNIIYYPMDINFIIDDIKYTYKCISQIEHIGNSKTGHYTTNVLRDKIYYINDSKCSKYIFTTTKSTYMLCYEIYIKSI
jgi:hypothetical protein